jgi:hypothetical protein
LLHTNSQADGTADSRGMVLAFILDDERFAPIKAQMMRRKLKQP